MKYVFENELIEGIIVKRKSQFTMIVNIGGEETACHCPTTGRIGDIEIRNIACLLSKSKDPRRKTPYTVEAVSADNLDNPCKNWIGINQILSNRLVEYFFETHQLDGIVSSYSGIRWEVSLGVSRLDFLVGDTYLEVKTPLTTLQVKYGSDIKTKPVTPFSSTDRFVKHINELAGSLKEHERAVLLTVYQYEITEPKERQKSTHYAEVSSAVREAKRKGLEAYEISMKFLKDGVELATCRNITDEL
ncbi:MAG: DNA/RNA nuclease SfsA [Ruminococcus flavefaciens]|nr:DNA/RNA nuclease SfsA [Ruminococcus flavefaciens]